MNTHGLKQHMSGFNVIYITQALFNGCFYGMKAIFVFYAINQFSLNEPQAINLFATFMILCYGTSLIGGYIADQGLGVKNTIIIGGTLSTFGLLVILFPFEDLCCLGLALISLGSGFLKPNMSAAVGLFFENPQDPRKDRAYSFFYMAMNLGGLVAPILCGFVGQTYGWHYGIFLVAMVFIGSTYFFHKKVQFHPVYREELTMSGTKLLGSILVLLALLYLLFKFQTYLHGLMGIITCGSLVCLGKIYYQCNLPERKDILTIIGYILLFTLACTLGEQAATSLVLFFEKAVNRQIMGMTIPSSSFLSLGPLFVLLCSPILLILSSKYLEKTKPINGFVKAGYGFLCVTVGFWTLALSTSYSNASLISPLWIVGALLIQTTGELWIAPISFSKISQYAPLRFKSILMSFWSMSIAYGHYFAGFIAQFSISSSVAPNLEASLEGYQSFFVNLSLLPLCVSLLLLFYQGYKVVKNHLRIGQVKYLFTNLLLLREDNSIK